MTADRASLVLAPAGLTLAALAAAACTPAAPCGLRQCDIRQPDCQHDIVRATACLRGLPPVDFPVTVKPQAVFVAEAEAEAAAVTEEAKQGFRLWQRGVSLLGLGDPNVSVTESAKQQAEWVAAYYLPSDKAVTVIDGGRPLDSRQAVTLLVHEAMHALQDRHVGLDAFRGRFPDDLDRMLASKAVTEGEASVVEDLAALALFGAESDDVRWGEVYGYWQGWARQESARTQLPVHLAWGLFPYPFGTPYVQAAHNQQGLAGLERLYAEPPASAGQVLAGYGAATAGGGPWSEELGADAVPQLPAPWAHFEGDRFGAWLWVVFVDRLVGRRSTRTGAEVLARATTSLRADWFSVLHDGAGGVVVAWRLRFASAELATQVAAALMDPRWSAIARDRDVLLFAGPWPGDPAQVSFGPVPPAARRVEARVSAGPWAWPAAPRGGSAAWCPAPPRSRW